TTCTGTSNGDYYDFFGATGTGFAASFVGVDVARPFLGNLNAPASSVGIFAGDACNLFGVTGATAATTPVSCGGTMPDNTLLSMTALGQTCVNFPSANCNVVQITKNDVRYIVNAGEAQSIFGTPFGTARRNLSQDAITNIANLSVLKKFKITERTSFEFRTTLLNAFNHPNFQTVDPFIEDAGLRAQGTGFGDPTLTNSVPFGYASANTRIIYFGGTIRF
ncbi:MAG TPA: hypothetical protein VKL40_15820, partial [Candidatus Angelobacter sp.]|nr:hypothetical protein [Candidatus Angelobacter sp.]